MSIPYPGILIKKLKNDIENKTGIKILDIHLKSGVWMALLNIDRDGNPEWERVTDLLSKPRFNIKIQNEDSKLSMYLI